MADFSALKAAIQAAIRQNGNNEITGNIMQGILLSMVNTMGDAAINVLISEIDTLTTFINNTESSPTKGSTNLVTSGGVYDSVFKVYSEIFSCLQKNLNIFIKNMNIKSSSSSPSVVNYDGYIIGDYGELQTADPASYKVRKLNVSPGEIYYIKKFGAGVGVSDLAFYSGETCKGVVSYFSDNISAYIIVPAGIDSVYVQILNNVPSEEFTIYETVGDYSFIFNLLKNAMREIPAVNKYSITERSEYILLQGGIENTYNQAMSSGLYPFNPDNKYVYNGDVEYSLNPVAYYDIYGNIIGYESVADGLVTDYELTNIPSGTFALRFCSWSDMNVVVSSAASEQIEKIPQIEDAIDIVDDCTVVGYSRGTDITSHATKYENKIFDTSSGSMITFNGFSVYMMSVSPGEVYEVTECVSYLAIYAYILLDGNGNVIDYFPRNETPGPVYYNENIVIPNNAATLVVHEYTGAGTHPVSIYQSSKREILSADACLVGMKWVCVGDSLTEINNTSTKFYHEYVKEATGINVVNMGVSGTGYKRGEDGNNAFYQRILNIPLDADVITIFGSGNDNPYWRDNLGTAWDTGTSTVGGCINTTLDNLYSIMPLANVALVTPTPWKGTEPYYFGQEYTNWFEKYCELIVEICKIRGIPCLDLFHESGLRPSIEAVRQIAYSRDGDNGVHPNEIGHKLIAPRFKMLVESMLI